MSDPIDERSMLLQTLDLIIEELGRLNKSTRQMHRIMLDMDKRARVEYEARQKLMEQPFRLSRQDDTGAPF